MKAFIYAVLLVLILVSCKPNKPADPATESVDSLTAQVDSEADDSMSNPPKAADGLFDDFIYSFMRNKRFQRERIKFPLTNVIDGTNHPIAQSEWKYDPLYVKQDVYTLVFDNARGIKAEKDTTLRHVVFEWVYLKSNRVKQYFFDKENGMWKLTSIVSHDMSQNINHDFYVFYHHFSTNTTFQRKHILNPFHFKTYDYDNFQNIEGLLDVNQWPDFRPKLPSGVITNINYGQSYANSQRRVLMICSQSGGMGCSLSFLRKNGTRMLEKLEN